MHISKLGHTEERKSEYFFLHFFDTKIIMSVRCGQIMYGSPNTQHPNKSDHTKHA